jgi:membrane-associated phospholipid phosphatase
MALSLVYLGEHYVTDLIAGAALAEGVRRAVPRAQPVVGRVSRAVQALEARAHA